MSTDPLTWSVLKKTPSGTRLELYVRRLGIWVEARVWHEAGGVVSVEPEAMWDGLQVLEFSPQLDADELAYRLRFIRWPMPKGHRVLPGPYRDLLEALCRGVIRIYRDLSEHDEGLGSFPEMKKAFRHLIRSGGFHLDLWTVFVQVCRQEFTANEEDGPLLAILREIGGQT